MLLDGKILAEGLGLHSGKPCRLTLEPCATYEIILFSQGNASPLRLLRTLGTNRGSDYIFPDGKAVRTCEHVLSALYGLGIYWGVSIHVDGGEMPALDGCAEYLCSQLLKHSIEGERPVKPVEVKKPFMVKSEDGKRFITAFPSNCLRITYIVEYDNVGTQMYDYVHTPHDYINEIMRARTFAVKSEIEYLRSHGMALGGSLENAVLIGDREGEVYAKNGLRWNNEFVRHKILDLIGDLASIGRPLNAHITAVKAGHELHLKLAEKLKEDIYV